MDVDPSQPVLFLVLVVACVVIFALALVGAFALAHVFLGRKQRTSLNASKLLIAEDALRASEERFALAVAGSLNGLWDWDIRTGSVYYSPRFQELLGYSQGGMENTLEAWKTRLHPEDVATTMAAVDAHLNNKRPFSHRYRLRCRQGDYRWFHASGQAVWAKLAEASGWDMRGKPPAKLHWDAVHLFSVAHGRPSVERLNVR